MRNHRFVLPALSLAFVGLVAAAPRATADTSLFKYEVGNYPHNAATCADATATLAARFTAVTKVAVFSSDCQDEQNAYAITLSYAANAALPLESTYDAVNTDLGQGGYQSAADCTADLNAQVAMFTKATGLAPIVAYCFDEGYVAGSDFEIKLRIDGLGAAQQHYYDFSRVLGSIDDNGSNDGQPTQSQAAAQSMAAQLSHLGATPSRALVRTDNSGVVTLDLQYYAPSKLPLEQWHQLSFDSGAGCQAEVAPAQAAFNALGKAPVGYLCAIDSGFTSMNIIRLKDPTVSIDKITGSYATLDLCHAAKDGVVANVKATVGWNVGGAVCSGINGDISVYVIRTVDAPTPPAPHTR